MQRHETWQTAILAKKAPATKRADIVLDPQQSKCPDRERPGHFPSYEAGSGYNHLYR